MLKKLFAAVLILTLTFSLSLVAMAATKEQIEAAIEAGVVWLVKQQNDADGSWGDWDRVAKTGFAVVKLQDRARELPTSKYDDEIQAGLDYIFGQATIDPYSPDTGISFAHGDWTETYCTGIAMMAIANDGDLSQLVTTGPTAGQTYGDVLQGNVDFFVSSQNANGGWAYRPGDWPDQSNSGYAVLGLGYAKGVGIDTSAVDAGLTNWIDAIQNKNAGHPYEGGSYYTTGGGWENELKTGNLIFQMTFVGIGPDDARFDAAIVFIEKYWQAANQNPGWGYNINPSGYQAMYCLMKGLQYSGVDEIDTDGVPGLEDWFNQKPTASPSQDFASVLVAQQNEDGFWRATDWGDPILCTAWALLTLEKVTVVHHIEVPVDIKPTSCPNPLNVKSGGVLPAAILGTEDFDVTQVDPASIILGLEVEEGVSPLRWAYEDVATPFEGEQDPENPDPRACTTEGLDGYLDLTLKFDSQEVVAVLGEVSDGDILVLTLTGNLKEEFGGISIEGQDVVIIRKKGKKAPAAPLAFAALAPYPNPLNPETWIPYRLADGVEVSITIYSASGQLICLLDLGYRQPGAYVSKSRAAYWDGRNKSGEQVGSGIYFYKLQAGEFSAIRKLIVVR